MTISTQRPAELEADSLQALNELEREFKMTLVAYEEPEFADLNQEQLKRIQSLEKKLGSTVIAYKQ